MKHIKTDLDEARPLRRKRFLKRNKKDNERLKNEPA